MEVPLRIQEEDEEVIKSVVDGVIDPASYDLEDMVGGDGNRAAMIRREAFQRKTGKSLVGLPFDGFNYNSIMYPGCERPVGYVQIPVGIAGPLLLDGKEYMVPLATTEGYVLTGTDRGCKAIYKSGDASSALLRDGITSTPVVRFASALRAAKLKFYLENPLNFNQLSGVFNRESRLFKLESIKCMVAGKNLYARFSCITSDFMGSKLAAVGAESVLIYLRKNDFPDMDVIGSSGNFCSEKMPAAVNWIEGRGKSVVCEAIIKEKVVREVLETSVSALAELNMLKTHAGSAVAGALGGSNVHATNVVTAIFLATGQDPAQSAESSNCITMMEPVNDGKDLHVSVTMPSIVVGTIGGGGGTHLASQSACLKLLGVAGVKELMTGSNAKLLATIVAGSVLAAELSLMSSICQQINQSKISEATSKKPCHSRRVKG